MALASLDGGSAGKVVVTLETASEGGIVEQLAAMRDLPGVLSAVLVYHQVQHRRPPRSLSHAAFPPRGHQGPDAATAAAVAGIALPADAANVVVPGDEAALTWNKAPCRFCGTGCGVVAVKEGRVVATHGDINAEVNRGLNCVKAASSQDHARRPADHAAAPNARR